MELTSIQSASVDSAISIPAEISPPASNVEHVEGLKGDNPFIPGRDPADHEHEKPLPPVGNPGRIIIEARQATWSTTTKKQIENQPPRQVKTAPG